MAGLELVQMRLYVRKINTIFINHGITGTNQMLCEYLNNYLGKPYVTDDLTPKELNHRKEMRLALKKHAPKWIYMVILKLKRLILGPRHKKVTYDD